MIFVDTGVWYVAMSDTGAEGDRTRGVIGTHAGETAVTDAVLTELWNLLQRRGMRHRATPACRQVLETSTVLAVGRDDRGRALRILLDWADQPFSYADALSFTVMEREGIDTVLTFDRHFRVYRYGPGRRRRFTVLRD